MPGGSTRRKGTGMFVPVGSGTVAVPMPVRVELQFGQGPQGPLSVPVPETNHPWEGAISSQAAAPTQISHQKSPN